jgi:hypothetical protein
MELYYIKGVYPKFKGTKDTYGTTQCPFCASEAVAYRYDAKHFPHLIYGYEYRCLTCELWFEPVSFAVVDIMCTEDIACLAEPLVSEDEEVREAALQRLRILEERCLTLVK